MNTIESLEARSLLSASLNSTTGVLTVVGTSRDDSIAITVAAGKYKVTQNGKASYFAATKVKSVVVKGGAGSDSIKLDATVKVNATLYANGVSATTPGIWTDFGDVLIGGAGNDRLVAGDGPQQRLYGALGNDTLDLRNQAEVEAHGGNGNDKFVHIGSGLLYGEAGRDTADFSDKTDDLVIGNAAILQSQGHFQTDSDPILAGFENFNGGKGNDEIWGTDGDNVIHGNGGNDRIYGLKGRDAMFGEAGNDFSDARDDGSSDFVSGGTGFDKDVHGGEDTVTGVEQSVMM